MDELAVHRSPIADFFYDVEGNRILRDPALHDLIERFYLALESGANDLAAATGGDLLRAAGEKGDWHAVVRLLTSGLIAQPDAKLLDRLSQLAGAEPRVLDLLHRRRIALADGEAGPICRYAQFLKQKRRYQEALQLLTLAERQWPANVSVKCELSNVYLHLANQNLAAQFAEQAMALDNGNQTAIELYLEATRFSPMLTLKAMGRLGISITTSNPTYLFYLCIAHRNSRSYAYALNCARKYLEISPDGPRSPNMRRHHADLLKLMDVWDYLLS